MNFVSVTVEKTNFIEYCIATPGINSQYRKRLDTVSESPVRILEYIHHFSR